MGQKVNPIGLRVGINRSWQSLWFATKKQDFSDQILQDFKIRTYLLKEYKKAAVSEVLIERLSSRIRIKIRCARPGVLIGKKGSDIEKLKQAVSKIAGNSDISLDMEDVRKADLDARLVAANVASQFEKRISPRRAMKKAVSAVMKAGAIGVKIICSGRLGGVEIARREWYMEGVVPLHTLRASIDYGFAVAYTTHGTCGIKVIICTGTGAAEGAKN